MQVEGIRRGGKIASTFGVPAQGSRNAGTSTVQRRIEGIVKLNWLTPECYDLGQQQRLHDKALDWFEKQVTNNAKCILKDFRPKINSPVRTQIYDFR